MTTDKQDPAISYLILRAMVEIAWWMTVLVLPLMFVAFTSISDSFMTYDVGLEIERPSYELLPLEEGGAVPVLEDLRGSLLLPGVAPGPGFWIVSGLLYLMTVVFVKNLRDLVRSLRHDRFVKANPKRVMRIGWLLMVFAVFELIGPGLRYYQLEGVVYSRGLRLSSEAASIDLTAFFYPLLVIVLAQVFKRGADLEAERDLTV